jgi:hypothetical protein
MNKSENQKKISKLPKVSKTKTTKTMKDPNKPKKNKCAYLFFCDENRSKVKAELGENTKPTEVTSALGAKWNELKKSTKDSDKKQLEKYESAALVDRKRYEEENGGIHNKKCQCGKARPTYNEPGEKKPIYCSTCKSDTMVDVVSKQCHCGKAIPCYNNPGEKKPIYCSECKSDTMVDVSHKKCHCGKARPSYNNPGEKIPIYCSKCKSDTMVNVKHKKCHCGKARPSYNNPGEKIPIYCIKCKSDTMVNVVSKKCHCGKAIPYYNNPGEKKPIYCRECKSDTMVDVKNKKCHCGKAIPCYNNPGEKKPIYCRECKSDTMVDVKNKKCHCGKARPCYNNPGEKIPIYCIKCKSDTMVDVVSKKCLTPFCDTIVSNKMYEGYCTRCFMFTFPDKPIARNYKTKELTVADYVKSEFSDVDWISDKRVSGGCSLRRPDLLLDLGNKVMIIEIDENGHRDYDCSCENKRIMEISRDLGHRPIIFIRFNPDSYMKNGKKIGSCWSVNKNGICTISKNKKKEWTQRLNSLAIQILYWLENDTEKTVETIELYFDDVV